MIERNPLCISCALHEPLCSQVDRDTGDIPEDQKLLNDVRGKLSDELYNALIANDKNLTHEFLDRISDMSLAASTFEEILCKRNINAAISSAALAACTGPTWDMQCTLPDYIDRRVND